MSRIDWDPALETGDVLVDHQHRTIHEIFNDLESAHGEPDRVRSVLERLLDHALIHFATEEDLMHRTQYPADRIEEHQALHRELTEAARQSALDFRSGKLTDTGPLVKFLREWIVVHVHQYDLALIEHVRAQGAVAILPEPWDSSPTSYA